MARLPQVHRSHHALRTRARGAALVITLAMLVLLAGLLTAFFSLATSERDATRTAGAGLDARRLADSTVSLVIAQLRDATSASAHGQGWASQPGAIRTFGDPALPDASRIFKLYSADQMIQAMAACDPAADSVWPAPGLQLPFGFTDLNQPLRAEDGSFAFPIVNPKAKYNVRGDTIDPAAPLVEGFRCADLFDPVRKDEFGNPLPLLPLPVKWLYALKDGSIGTLETLQANPDPQRRPSRNNPVVGRTAFWTDDESAKINLNTASEPTYWSTPLTTTAHELGITASADGFSVDPVSAATSLNLAIAQPAPNEFQRYPGHPATTSLSPVLRRLFNTPASRADGGYKEFVYQLAPHIYSGRASGRLAGFDNLSSAAATRNAAPRPGSAALWRPLPLDSERLLASPDEFLFRATRRDPATGALFTSADPGGYLPAAAGTLLTPHVLERLRFFLTASSRAPELSIFGRPRVAIWPVPLEPQWRTGCDKAVAQAATVGPTSADGFFFQRQVADPSGQINLGRGTENGSRSRTAEWDRIAQNQSVYRHLQRALRTPPPGCSKSLAEKFGADADQVLTEIWDFIRCTNLNDSSASGAAPYTPAYLPDGNPSGATNRQPLEWSGQVIPLRIGENQTQGLGRFVTLTEAAIAFFVPEERESPPAGPFTAEEPDGAPVMRAVLVFEFATPMAGHPGLRDSFAFSVTCLEKMEVQAGATVTPDIFPATSNGRLGANLVEVDALHGAIDCAHTPGRGYTIPMLKWRAGASPGTGSASRTAKAFVRSGVPGVNRNEYPFLSREIAIGESLQEFTVRGGRFRLDLYAGATALDPERLVQSFEFTFTPGGRALLLPKPLMIGADPFEPDVGPFVGRRFERNLAYDDKRTAAFFGNTFKVRNPSPSDSGNVDIQSRTLDTVRSVELNGATRGDWRLAQAAGVTAPLDAFQPRLGAGAATEYFDPQRRVVHGLKHGRGERGAGNAPRQNDARFAAGSEISARPPDLPVPARARDGVRRNDGGPGDWDRGITWFSDGPLANKPDEGSVRFATSTGDTRLPYMVEDAAALPASASFSPSRMLASPVAFGSLPTGVKRMRPWETLLFRPDRPAAGEPAHPGAQHDGFPADHWLLDLFWMPVIEPWSISEPGSTAGKVNMNYAAAPFSYLRSGDQRYWVRDTALRAVLKGVKLTAARRDMHLGGHDGAITGTRPNENAPAIRFDIDPDKTLEDFESRLFDADSAKAFFRSAGEICEMDLYPFGPTKADGQPLPEGTDRYPYPALPRSTKAGAAASRAAWGAFWATNALTGDNGRELPYLLLHPRLTTQSNVFTVHLRCQTVQLPAAYYQTADGELDLAKLKSDFAAHGDPAIVLGEYRGSSVIERFLDPQDARPSLSNAGSRDPATGSLESLHRFRVLSSKRL